MKLSDWASKNGLDYKTAYHLFRSGRFPRPAEQLPTGSIIVNDTEMKDDLVQDIVDVLASSCARPYGRRASMNKAKRALQATEK